jgi:hypothetical protein
MNTSVLQRSLLACVLLATAVSAQDQRPRGQRPGPDGPAQGARPRPVQQLEFVASGLTTANADGVTSALKALTYQVHACEACGVQRPDEGTCPKCQGPLEPRATALLGSVTVDDVKVRLAFAPGAPVRTSVLEKALETQGVSIDPALFTLSGRLTLDLIGGEAAVPGVQQALEASGHFSEVHATFDSATGALRCGVRCGDGVTLASLRDALSKSSATLADVAWGGRGPEGARAVKRRGPGAGENAGKRNPGKRKKPQDD